jgi:hypothetical protein
MDLIEVILLNYRFKFRPLFWKEEFDLKPEGKDERRVLLATALVEVSGLKIKNFEEAYRVLNALPTSILHRVFLIYKGKQPETRVFTTYDLYKAPDTTAYGQQLTDEEVATDKAVDAAVARMEQQFSKKELEETAEIDRQIIAGAKTKQGFRGAVPKDADEEDMNPLGGFKAGPHA